MPRARTSLPAVGFVIVVAVLALATPAFAQNPDQEYSAHINEGLEHLRGKRFQLAKAEFDAAIEIDAARYLAYYNLACVFALWIDEPGSGGSVEEKQQAAIKALQDAASRGWDDIEHMERDEDLNNLRDLDGYKEVVRSIQNRLWGPRNEEEADPLLYETFMPSGSATVPALFFCHAHASNNKRAKDALSTTCVKLGWALVLIQGPVVVQQASAQGGVEAMYGWGEHRVFSVLRTIQDFLATDDGKRVDPAKITIGGDTQGAYIALSAALKRPERFRGVFLLAAPLDGTTFESSSLRAAGQAGLKVFLGCSESDTLGLAGSRAASERLQQLGLANKFETTRELTALKGGGALLDAASRYFG